MKYEIRPSSSFRHDLKRIKKQNKNIDLITDIIRKLANGESLPKENEDHFLSGNWIG